MSAALALVTAPWPLGAWLLAILGALSAAIALIGIGSMAHMEVTRRRQEFAVRLAVGADPAAIRAMILRVAVRRALVALVIGFVLAFVANRALRGLLYGVELADSTTHVTVLVFVLASPIAATYWSARSATRTDPAVLLRAE